MARAVSATLAADDLIELGEALLRPTALIELALVGACLLGAWVLLRLARGPEPQRGSIWFGRGVVDGVLFPLLALLFALLARWALASLWRGHTPAVPIAVFKLVIPILVSLAAIRLTGRVLRSAFPASAPLRNFERSLSWFAWVAVALWITGVLPLILQELDTISWKMGTSEVSVRNIIEGAFTAVVVLMAALSISSALEARLLKGATENISSRKIAANALRAVLLLVGLIFALEAAGIDLTALGVLGGALGVGIGLGLQKLAANYVSGFVILAERSMRIGDLVKVDNFEGRITDISTRYTVIRALNGREAIVPNEMMITQRVENSSLADPRVLLSTTVQVAYGSDLETLMPRLSAAVAAVPRVVTDTPPAVQLSAFAADGLELTVAFWIDDPQNGQGNVRSAVNLAILRSLNAAGVEIPFPQRVLHALPAAGPGLPPSTGAATSATTSATTGATTGVAEGRADGTAGSVGGTTSPPA
jgi:small-conductance mechanosensitive channel